MIRKLLCALFLCAGLSVAASAQYGGFDFNLGARTSGAAEKSPALSGGAQAVFHLVPGGSKHDLVLIPALQFTGDHPAALQSGHSTQFEVVARVFQKEYSGYSGLFAEGGPQLDHQVLPNTVSVNRFHGIVGGGYIRTGPAYLGSTRTGFGQYDLLIGRVDYITPAGVRASVEYDRVMGLFTLGPKVEWTRAQTYLGTRNSLKFTFHFGINLDAAAGS